MQALNPSIPGLPVLFWGFKQSVYSAQAPLTLFYAVNYCIGKVSNYIFKFWIFTLRNAHKSETNDSYNTYLQLFLIVVEILKTVERNLCAVQQKEVHHWHGENFKTDD